jgi:hypothetical protein
VRLDTLLSNIILVTFLVTVVMAVGSYAGYKLRERRRPRAEAERGTPEPFFHRVTLTEYTSGDERPGRRGAFDAGWRA